MKLVFLVVLAIVGLSNGQSEVECPSGFESIRGGCYKYVRDALNWAEADLSCRSEDGGDHLWSYETEKEYECVMYSGISSRSGARGLFWTDGKLTSMVAPLEAVWTHSLDEITFIPKYGLANVCCSGSWCYGHMDPGMCLTMGRVSFGAAETGDGLLGCDCDGPTVFPYLCEKEVDGPEYELPPDVSPDCECKPNHLQAVRGNDTCYYNCHNQVGGIECCPDGTVFVEMHQGCY